MQYCSSCGKRSSHCRCDHHRSETGKRRADGERHQRDRSQQGGSRRRHDPSNRKQSRHQQPRQRSGRPPGGPSGGPDQPGDPRNPDDSDGISLGRRAFLVGGAGIAALAGGSWWFFLRGPGGAKGVVEAAFEALDSNDWDRFEALFHEDSTLRRQIEDREGVSNYEEYLEDIGTLEREEQTRIEVLGLHEMEHVTDPDGETANRFDPAEHDVREFKQILAVIERDRTGWEELDEDDDPVRRWDNTIWVALNSDGDWKLW